MGILRVIKMLALQTEIFPELTESLDSVLLVLACVLHLPLDPGIDLRTLGAGAHVSDVAHSIVVGVRHLASVGIPAAEVPTLCGEKGGRLSRSQVFLVRHPEQVVGDGCEVGVIQLCPHPRHEVLQSLPLVVREKPVGV